MKRLWFLGLLLIPYHLNAVSYDSGSGALSSTSDVSVTTVTANSGTFTNLSGTTLSVSSATVSNLISASSGTITNISGVNLVLGGSFRPPASATPRTSVTPSFIGMLIFNMTQNEFCVSSGTVASSWVKVNSTTTACGS